MNKRNKIDSDTWIIQTAHLLTTELDGETVMMSLTQEAYFGLDSTAQHIWGLIAQPRRVADLCEILIEQYEVSRETREEQVCTFLTELHKEGLARIVEEGG
jgi:hypothetical protein